VAEWGTLAAHTRTEAEGHSEARGKVVGTEVHAVGNRAPMDNGAVGRSEARGMAEDKQDRLAQDDEAQAEVGEGSEAEVQGKERSVCQGKQDMLGRQARAEEEDSVAEVQGRERSEALGNAAGDRVGRQAGQGIEVAEDKKPREVVLAEAQAEGRQQGWVVVVGTQVGSREVVWVEHSVMGEEDHKD